MRHPPAAAADRRPVVSVWCTSGCCWWWRIVRGIWSLPSGSAGGPDSITPHHLNDLVSSSTGLPGVANELLKSVTDCVNLMLNGEMPGYINDVIFGGTLIDSVAGETGQEIRPINIGSTWLRMAAMCANAYVINRMAGHTRSSAGWCWRLWRCGGPYSRYTSLRH